MIIYDDIIKSINPGGGISILFDELRSHAKKNNIEFENIQPSSVHRLSLERYLKCSIPDCFSKRPAVFHSTYYRRPSTNIPTVTTVHDFTYEKYSHGLKKTVHSWQKYQAIRCSQALICVSENTKIDLLHYIPEIDKDIVHIVHNGVSGAYHHNGNYNFSDYVLFVGARGGYKNFTAAVEALAHQKNLRLICVGGGNFSKVETNFLNKHIPTRYRHAGYVSQNDLNDLYNNSFCLIYPSLYEGFGIPVIEAMRAGCPVIASNSSSIPEIASGAALLMSTPNAESISLMIDLLKDPAKRINLIHLGLNQSKKFSWDSCYEKTFAIYEKLLSKPK